jgi:phosphinothricin acetyltransferase
MKFKIRRVTLEDEQAILKIFNYFVENSFAAYTEHAEGSAFFKKLWGISSGYPFYLAEGQDGRPIGFALIHPYYGMNVFRKTARITYFILPEYTRSGLGKIFLDKLTQDARELGIENILASISSLNEQSINFHKKHGFIECGRFKSIGEKWDQVFDEIWMQLEL